MSHLAVRLQIATIEIATNLIPILSPSMSKSVGEATMEVMCQFSLVAILWALRVCGGS